MEFIRNLTGKIFVQMKKMTQHLGLMIRRFKQRYPIFSKVIMGGLILSGLLLFSVLLLVFSIYFGAYGKLPTYPELENINNLTASEVYSEDKALLGKYFIENRVNANLDEISEDLRNALIATEDARFFKHHGIDLRAWVRVFFRTILLMDESGGGGSTLSQQLAKNLYNRVDYGWLSIPVNKIKELFTARRLERLYTKEELIRMYFNTVPFGGDIYGVKVAAKRFFDKSPDALATQEAALLVGMLKGPSYYQPVRHPDRALRRRNTVINQMYRYGYLEEAEAEELKFKPLGLAKYYTEGHDQGLATYFREHLRIELENLLKDFKKPNGQAYNLYTDGLKIYTSIDSRLQVYAENAVRKHMPVLQKQFYNNWRKGVPWGSKDVLEEAVRRSDRFQQLKSDKVPQRIIDSVFAKPIPMTIFDWEEGEITKKMSPLDSVKHYLTLLHTGFLAVEPNSGLVKAWVGGIDHTYFQYDHVKSNRQVGSIFKPIVFAQAGRNGMMPCEYTYNERITYAEYKGWSPRNSDAQYGGVYSMQGALNRSINVVAVEVLLRAGIDSVRNLAKNMGIKSNIPAVPAIGLGAVDASLYEMVQAYGTLANEGRRPILHYLDSITTADGELIVAFKRKEMASFPKVLSREESRIMNKMLQGVVNKGTASRLRSRYGLYNAIAGKTGTTQNQSDGWFMGYTPKIVAGVWVGAESPKVHFRTLKVGQGGNSALPIFGEFMKQVYEDPNFKDWKKARFRSPADTTVFLMDCPDYLEEMPLFVEYLQDYQENPGFINRVYQELMPQFDIEHMDLKKQRRKETDLEYIERMKAYNERLKKRQERKQRQIKNNWN